MSSLISTEINLFAEMQLFGESPLSLSLSFSLLSIGTCYSLPGKHPLLPSLYSHRNAFIHGSMDNMLNTYYVPIILLETEGTTVTK